MIFLPHCASAYDISMMFFAYNYSPDFPLEFYFVVIHSLDVFCCWVLLILCRVFALLFVTIVKLRWLHHGNVTMVVSWYFWTCKVSYSQFGL